MASMIRLAIGLTVAIAMVSAASNHQTSSPTSTPTNASVGSNASHASSARHNGSSTLDQDNLVLHGLYSTKDCLGAPKVLQYEVNPSKPNHAKSITASAVTCDNLGDDKAELSEVITSGIPDAFEDATKRFACDKSFVMISGDDKLCMASNTSTKLPTLAALAVYPADGRCTSQLSNRSSNASIKVELKANQLTIQFGCDVPEPRLEVTHTSQRVNDGYCVHGRFVRLHDATGESGLMSAVSFACQNGSKPQEEGKATKNSTSSAWRSTNSSNWLASALLVLWVVQAQWGNGHALTK